MRILTISAVLLFLAAIVDVLTPPSNAGIAVDKVDRPNVITAEDIKDMVFCTSNLLLITKFSKENTGEPSPDLLYVAGDWLQTALFFAPTVVDDYNSMIDEIAFLARLHSENLYGAKGQDGLFQDNHDRCSELIELRNETSTFVWKHGNE